MKVPAKSISSAALAKLTTYAFPGNIRELKNLLERALILGQSPEIQPEDIPLQGPVIQAQPIPTEITVEALATHLPKHLDLRETMAQLERALIVRSLALASGVQAEAARHLGLSRSDLGYKVSKYGLSGEPAEPLPN